MNLISQNPSNTLFERAVNIVKAQYLDTVDALDDLVLELVRVSVDLVSQNLAENDVLLAVTFVVQVRRVDKQIPQRVGQGS